MAREFNRTDRIGEAIQKKLATLIQYEVKDPEVAAWVTVSAVEVSKDLAYAKVYVSALGEEQVILKTVAALNRAAGFLRSCLAHELSLRTVPELKFLQDRSITEGTRIAALIDRVTPTNPESSED